jgi:hypothetical protein
MSYSKLPSRVLGPIRSLRVSRLANRQNIAQQVGESERRADASIIAVSAHRLSGSAFAALRAVTCGAVAWGKRQLLCLEGEAKRRGGAVEAPGK